jgi:uncharacterized protein
VIVTRLALVSAFVATLATLAVGIGLWVGLPYMERRWIFSPSRSAYAHQWQLPAGAEEVTFATADGVRLNGWFFDGRAPRSGITVLVLHGNQGVLPDYVPETEYLRARGFNVLLFNYRGFGISGGRSLDEATLDLDGAAALRYLTRERGIEPRSIALLGASLGAAVAANLAVAAPCRAVVLISAFASAREQARRIKPWVPDFILDLLNSPLDTIGKIGRANCPVLVVHGANDHSAPLEQAQSIYDAARSPKQFIVIEGAQHTLSTAEFNSYLGKVASFLKTKP